MSKSWVKIPFKTFKSSPLRQHCILIWPDGAQGKSVWDYRWTPVIQGLTLRFLKRDCHDIWLQVGFEKILFCDSNGGNYSLPGTIACSSPAPTPFLSLSWGFAIQGWPGEWWCGGWCLVDESQIRNKGWSWSRGASHGIGKELGHEQALAGSRISIPGFFGTGFLNMVDPGI